MTLPFSLEELREIRRAIIQLPNTAFDGKIRHSLRCVRNLVEEALCNIDGVGKIPARHRIYQFKISLQGVLPVIWRRIQVRNCTLTHLHSHLQTAMGWTDSHLHHFEVRGQQIGDPDLLRENFEEFLYEDSHLIRLTDIVPVSGEPFAFTYLYDFGDSWNHEVMFEGCLQATEGVRYPLCLEGERCCPPEDVGGCRGYERFLEIIADPEDDEREEMLAWAGKRFNRFNPEFFDAVKTTKKMHRGFPKLVH